jgi:hypothetical protein
MSFLSALRRITGKSLVATGLLGAIGLAVAAPLAFTLQLATPLQLLLVALCGVMACFVLIKVGDLIADWNRPEPAGQRLRTEALPRTREPRNRRPAAPAVDSASRQWAPTLSETG